MSQTKSQKSQTCNWMIRKFPIEVRSAVLMAAKKQGKSIPEWSAPVLLVEAQRQLTGKQEIAKPEDVADVLKEVFNKLEELSNKVNKPWWQKLAGK
jgi:hypothetical protein